jgi:hypothetical protein
MHQQQPKLFGVPNGASLTNFCPISIKSTRFAMSLRVPKEYDEMRRADGKRGLFSLATKVIAEKLVYLATRTMMDLRAHDHAQYLTIVNQKNARVWQPNKKANKQVIMGAIPVNFTYSFIAAELGCVHADTVSDHVRRKLMACGMVVSVHHTPHNYKNGFKCETTIWLNPEWLVFNVASEQANEQPNLYTPIQAAPTLFDTPKTDFSTMVDAVIKTIEQKKDKTMTNIVCLNSQSADFQHFIEGKPESLPIIIENLSNKDIDNKESGLCVNSDDSTLAIIKLGNNAVGTSINTVLDDNKPSSAPPPAAIAEIVENSVSVVENENTPNTPLPLPILKRNEILANAKRLMPDAARFNAAMVLVGVLKTTVGAAEYAFAVAKGGNAAEWLEIDWLFLLYNIVLDFKNLPHDHDKRKTSDNSRYAAIVRDAAEWLHRLEEKIRDADYNYKRYSVSFYLSPTAVTSRNVRELKDNEGKALKQTDTILRWGMRDVAATRTNLRQKIKNTVLDKGFMVVNSSCNELLTYTLTMPRLSDNDMKAAVQKKYKQIGNAMMEKMSDVVLITTSDTLRLDNEQLSVLHAAYNDFVRLHLEKYIF